MPVLAAVGAGAGAQEFEVTLGYMKLESYWFGGAESWNPYALGAAWLLVSYVFCVDRPLAQPTVRGDVLACEV